MRFNHLTEKDLADLGSFLEADQVSTGESNLNLHSEDQAYHKGYRPEAVVWPRSTEEVSKILALANERTIPVTPWGAGTSLEGNCVPVHGGIILDFQFMGRILEVRAEDFQVDVQPGLTYKDMNKVLARQGLFFPPDPGANATIGGMVANNASGIRTIKYGSTRDNVHRLKAVLASGGSSRWVPGRQELLGLRPGEVADRFGGDLGRHHRDHPQAGRIPEEFSAGVATFESVGDAADSVHGIMAYGLNPAALELLDAQAIGYINRDGRISLDEKPTLFIEFSGSNRAGVEESLRRAREVCVDHNGLDFWSGVGREERNLIWEARHGFGESLIRSNPGADVLLMDAAVPLSRFSALVEQATSVAAAHGLKACVSSHAGDGNLHLNVIGNMGDPAHVAELDLAYEEIVSFAVSCGGTITGEHGVGIGKRRFMAQEHGQSLELMRGIKNYFDPKGILNPGKVLPDED